MRLSIKVHRFMAFQDDHRKKPILTTTHPFEKVPDGFDVYENFTYSIYNGYTTYQSRKISHPFKLRALEKDRTWETATSPTFQPQVEKFIQKAVLIKNSEYFGVCKRLI